jgi:hypothetical protein
MFELNHVTDAHVSAHSPHFALLTIFNCALHQTSSTSQPYQPCSPPPSTTSSPPASPAATLVLWLAPILWPLPRFSARTVALALRLTRPLPIVLDLAKPWSGPSTSGMFPVLKPMPFARTPSTRTWSRSWHVLWMVTTGVALALAVLPFVVFRRNCNCLIVFVGFV